MTGYLVDTNAISGGLPARSAGEASRAIAWMVRHSDSLFLSVITIAEIEAGIAQARREGADRKTGRLADWLDTVRHLYASRIMVFDLAIACLAGTVSDRARGLGHAPGFVDLVIAATAQMNGMTILTRNVRHFARLAVAARDPFVGLPT